MKILKRFGSFVFIGIFSLYFVSGHAQTVEKQRCLNDKFETKVDSYLKYTIPAIGVTTLNELKDQVVILDAREPEEYAVSHIQNAQYIGHDDVDETVLEGIDKDQPIVIYCSIGYRSEVVGTKLKEQGFTKVVNLYGSIFEWVNQGYPVVDTLNQETNKVHTFNRKWSKWVENEDVEKVY